MTLHISFHRRQELVTPVAVVVGGLCCRRSIHSARLASLQRPVVALFHLGMSRNHLLWAVTTVAVLVGVVASAAAAFEDGGARKGVRPEQERRMTAVEREEVFKRLRKLSSRAKPPCVPPENPSHHTRDLPRPPVSFTTKVEVAYQEPNKTRIIYGAESFDGVFNMGVLRYELGEGIILTRPHDRQEIIHYNVPTNETLIIKTDTACEDEGSGNCDPKKSCRASTLQALSEEMQELFGYGDANGDHGYFGAGGILQWGPQYNYEYQGQESCRGMYCDKYTACITNPEEKATVLLTYYWSIPGWTVNSNKNQVPLAIEIIATGKFGHLFTREVMQRYDFYEFYSDVRPDPARLEPPADVYCKKRISKYEPPKAPRFFSYDSEAITPFTFSLPIGDGETQDVEFSVVFNQYVYYDWESKIVMTDYVPWFIMGEEYRYEHETRRVQEFNQGLTYKIQVHLNKCRVHRIENITSSGDVIVGDNGTVTLLPPWMFEDLDGPWQYNGQHSIRGASADVWVGMKKLLGPILEEMYVWYYVSPLVIDEPMLKKRSGAQGLWGGGGSGDSGDPPKFVSQDRVPMRHERYSNIMAGKPHTIYNMYDYLTQPPYTHSIDISLCYTDSKMRHFRLDLPRDTLDKVKGLQDNLLYAAAISMAEIAVVSPLRINRAVLEVKDDKLGILFTLLDLPDEIGDSVWEKQESDLNKAANIIINSIHESKLVIVVHLPVIDLSSLEPPYVAVVPTAITEVNRKEDNTYSYSTSKGYESGDMAGLAVGMLLLGALVGVAINFALQRQSEGKGGLPRVTMARRSPLSPSNTISINSDMAASDI